MAVTKILQGHRTAQRAHCGLVVVDKVAGLHGVCVLVVVVGAGGVLVVCFYGCQSVFHLNSRH